MTVLLKKKQPQSNLWPLIGKGVLLPLNKYKKKIVAFSGGKDSLALLLYLLESGVPKEEIELWHHLIDGGPGVIGNFDWPCTEDYVRAIGCALGVPVRFSWKDGGFAKEMFRENSLTTGVYFEDEERNVVYLPPQKPPLHCKECRRFYDSETQSHCPECGEPRDGFSTRLKYPMVTSDLTRRWCSAYLKIMVCRRVISNDPRFNTGNVLLLTGERRQESDARAEYDEAEPHASSNKKRRVDQWRAVIDWTEQDVWRIIEKWRVMPHPAYRMGWGRVSCMTCIFGGPDEWASVRHIAPTQFGWHAANERRFSLTIKDGESVTQQANRGTNFAKDAPRWLIDMALSQSYPRDQVIVPDGEWVLPAGAYKRCGGPT